MADLGTLPQQVTAISSGGIFLSLIGLLIKWNLGRSRLSLEAKKQHDVDEADIRDHYAKEVERLTERIEKNDDRYRRLLAESEKAQDALRKRVTFLEDEIKGLIRLITYNSAHTVLQLGDDVPDDIRATAERVKVIMGGGHRT
jgi:ABC-type nitrate/sulfonate/bicarbonate transport system substrate-binding protein